MVGTLLDFCEIAIVACVYADFKSFHSIMPITNGDICSPHVSTAEISDYTKALNILEAEYAHGDGLDIRELVDSDKRGALTYNDFLILPGYIGTRLSFTYQGVVN